MTDPIGGGPTTSSSPAIVRPVWLDWALVAFLHRVTSQKQGCFCEQELGIHEWLAASIPPEHPGGPVDLEGAMQRLADELVKDAEALEYLERRIGKAREWELVVAIALFCALAICSPFR